MLNILLMSAKLFLGPSAMESSWSKILVNVGFKYEFINFLPLFRGSAAGLFAV